MPGGDGASCRVSRSELIPLNFVAQKPLEIAGRIAGLFVLKKTIDYFDTLPYIDCVRHEPRGMNMNTTKGTNVALYLRVSTDGQTVANQKRELEGMDERAGWEILEIYQDKGISGAKGRNGRPELNRMMEDATRRRFKKLLVWDLSRLGRSLRDLIGITDHFQELGVDVYVHKDAIDTGTASGRLFFHIVGAIGEFERERTRERINAGLARAKEDGKKLGRPKGSTKDKVKHQAEIESLRDAGMSVRKIAGALRVSTSTVQAALKRAM